MLVHVFETSCWFMIVHVINTQHVHDMLLHQEYMSLNICVVYRGLVVYYCHLGEVSCLCQEKPK